MSEILTQEQLKRVGLNKPFEPERTTEKSDSLAQEERLMEGIGTWISYFRSNPHRFVSEYLQLKPFSWFQKILLFLMFKNSYFMWWASRGIGKTHLTALFCVVKAILYPDSHIVVVSGIKMQALEIISGKIMDFKLKCPNLALEISDIRPNMQDARVDFHNGSWIKIVAANDNARGTRATVLNITGTYNRNIIKKLN